MAEIPAKLHDAMAEVADRKGRISVGEAVVLAADFFAWQEASRPKRRSRMKVIRVTERSVLVMQACAACTSQVQAGEQVAYRRNSLDETAAYDHYLVIHVTCMVGLVDKAEPEPAEKSFEQARDQFSEMEPEWANTLS